MTDIPILYSFRRCPYAMRARLAIAKSKQRVILREVVLREKPKEMLKVSPKGTVPVLQLADGTVIDESYDIMLWALKNNDPDNWLRALDYPLHKDLLEENDGNFKKRLDRYKYANRHPEKTEVEHRAEGEGFLQKLEQILEKETFLIDKNPSLTDAAIFPFLRQFTRVDQEWFEKAPYPHIKRWLNHFYNSKIYQEIMPKYPQWHRDDKVTFFP